MSTGVGLGRISRIQTSPVSFEPVSLKAFRCADENVDKSELESAFLDLVDGKTPSTPLPQPVTFSPSRVDGLPDVSTVTVNATQLVFHTPTGNHTHSFASIGRRQESCTASLLKRCTFRRPWPQMVADRSWCIDPLRAISFSTPIRMSRSICLPAMSVITRLAASPASVTLSIPAVMQRLT